MTRQITTREGHILTVKNIAGKETVMSAELNSDSDTLTIPDSQGLQSIGSHVLGEYVQSISLAAITLPEGLRSIRESAFEGCSSLAEITLPKGLYSIGSWAFAFCISLTTITLPEGLQSIQYFTFSDCSSLQQIVMPLYGAIKVHQTSCPANEKLTVVQHELLIPLPFDDFCKGMGPYYKKSPHSLPPLARASRYYYSLILHIAERIYKVDISADEQAAGASIVSAAAEDSTEAIPALPPELWLYILSFVSEKKADRKDTAIHDINCCSFWQQTARTEEAHHFITLFDGPVVSSSSSASSGAAAAASSGAAAAGGSASSLSSYDSVATSINGNML